MQPIPLECTLTPVRAADRVDEWRAFLAADVEEAVLGTAEARLRLRQSETATLSAIDLAAREKACCAFFTFSIDIQADQRWLVVRVDDEAAPVLGDFLSLLPEELRQSSSLLIAPSVGPATTR